MASNEQIVRENYQDGREEGRATASRYAQLEFFYTEEHIREYIRRDTAVLEVGCGTGYYALQFAGRCREYVGVDITPANIDLLNEKVRAQGLTNVRGQVGDATDLREIADGSFDVVLCLGPLYHLPPPERELVFAECRRVCKDQGIAAFSYINRVGVYAGACVHDTFRETYPNETANERVLVQGRDDVRPDLFFYTMPEEIEALAQKYGFSKRKNLGTDFFVTMSAVEVMSDEQFAAMKPLLDQMTSHESCTGMSNHALLVCQK